MENNMNTIEFISTMDNSSRMRCVVCNASLQILKAGVLVASTEGFNAFVADHGACVNYSASIPMHRCVECGGLLEAIPTKSGDPEAAVIVRCEEPSCERFFGFFATFDEARAAVHQANKAADAAWEALKGEPEQLDLFVSGWGVL